MLAHRYESKDIVSIRLYFFSNIKNIILLLCFRIIIGEWVKYVWQTTCLLYESVLSEWHTWTSGGSGISTLFESWSDEKLEKYNILIDDYDHTDVANQRAVVLSEHYKQRTPYLTIIHL